MANSKLSPFPHTPLWTALVTPMLEDGAIDYAGLEVLVRQQEAAGNGILVLGSTGEALNLSQQERKEVLQYVSQMNLKVPLMVGVGGIHLTETLEWLAFCETQKVDCYLLVTPLYAKPGPKGQEQWFRSLLDRVTRPCMLYNIPGRAGVALNLQAVAKLQDHPQFWAIKEASGNVHDFENYRLAAPQAEIYSGDDGMMPYFAAVGARGLVSVVSNLWPEATQLYTKKCLAGKFEGLFPVWTKATQALFRASNPIPAKVGLHALGVISTPYLRPPLTHLELPSTDELMQAHQMVKSWEVENNL